MIMTTFEQFREQLLDFEKERLDVLLTRYHPMKRTTAGYVEKKLFLTNAAVSEILASYNELTAWNEQLFNVYIRPSSYANSRLIILDDFHSTNSIGELSWELQSKGLDKNDFYLSFAILTSKVGKKLNYQLGIEYSDSIPLSLKPFILEQLCNSLKCDSAHAKIHKYFRVAGFLNKKYKEPSNQLEMGALKDTPIVYKKFIHPKLQSNISNTVTVGKKLKL